MELKGFGKIALIVNEFGGLKRGEVHVNNNGELVIQYGPMYQTIAPHDLNALLVVKQNEYAEELAPLVAERDDDEAPSWRERNLKSYIGYLVDISYKLNELHTFQREQAEDKKK